MRVIEYEFLRVNLAAELKKAYAENEVTVVAYLGTPAGVLMSRGVWSVGQQQDKRRHAVAESLVDRINSRAARPMLRELREKLSRGRHIIVTVWSEEAVFAPYDWARQAFPEWELPEVLHESPEDGMGETCAQVVYRARRNLPKMREEFEGAEDPEWEMDRRLSGTRSLIPPERRERLRGVVYVEGGQIVRVRAVDPTGEWVDLEDRRSLAPVSAPLTRKEIDALMPGLGLYPGDQRLAPKSIYREYIEM